MGPIEFSLLVLFLFYCYTTYKTKTLEMAIEKRKEMVEVVREITLDPTASIEFKRVAVALFHLSVIPTSLPSLIYTIIKYRKEAKKHRLVLNSEHQQKFETLLNGHFFKINVLCAPHYYVLLALFFFFLVLFLSPIAMWKKYIASLQEKVSDPACMAAVRY